MRWAIATKAIAFGLPDADERLCRARPSATSRIAAAARCCAPRPRGRRAEAKERAWQQIHGDGYGSFHLTRAAMHGRLLAQPGRARRAVRRTASSISLREVFETRDHPFARSYLLTLYPAYRADPSCCRSLQSAARRRSTAQLPTLSRQLAEVTDELERAIRVRRFAEELSPAGPGWVQPVVLEGSARQARAAVARSPCRPDRRSAWTPRSGAGCL